MVNIQQPFVLHDRARESPFILRRLFCPKPIPRIDPRPPDGVPAGIKGRWISEADAKARSVGNKEWWRMEGFAGKTVEIKQYDTAGPSDKPIWMWESGNMYIGEWRSNGPNEHASRDGFGACFYLNKAKNKGKVYIGEFKNSTAHGYGKTFWLESVPRLAHNRRIRQSGIPRPSVYSGTFVNNMYQDEFATVTLSDGTTRVGPWKGGEPIGDWWKDHKLVTAATATRQTAPVKSKDPTIPTIVASTRSGSLSAARRNLTWKHLPLETSLDEHKSNAHLAEHTQNDRTRLKPSHVISLNNSDDNDDSENQGNESPAAVLPGRAASLQGQVTSIGNKEDRVKEIREWFVTVIGCNPIQEEMDAYARKFITIGLHSIDMIISACTKEDVADFDWMSKFHKRRVASALSLDFRVVEHHCQSCRDGIAYSLAQVVR